MQTPAPQLFAPPNGEAAQILVCAMMFPQQWMRRGAGAKHPHGLSVNDRFQHNPGSVLVGVPAACQCNYFQTTQ